MNCNCTQLCAAIKSYLLFACLLLSFSSQITASGDLTLSGARQAGMANTSVMLVDAWGISNNPAAISFLSSGSLGIYHQNRFLLEELSYQTIAFSQPTGYGTIGVDLGYFGYQLYNEKRLGLAYSLKLHKRLAAAIKLNYLHSKIAGDYGTSAAVYGEIGLLAEPIDNLHFGIHLINPSNQKLNSLQEETIPSSIKLGAGYYFTKNFLLAIELEKPSELSYQFRTGIDFELVDDFFLRMGIGNKPNLIAFGFGYHRKNIVVDIAFSKHEYLGYSPHISLVYHFSKNK